MTCWNLFQGLQVSDQFPQFAFCRQNWHLMSNILKYRFTFKSDTGGSPLLFILKQFTNAWSKHSNRHRTRTSVSAMNIDPRLSHLNKSLSKSLPKFCRTVRQFSAGPFAEEFICILNPIVKFLCHLIICVEKGKIIAKTETEHLNVRATFQKSQK